MRPSLKRKPIAEIVYRVYYNVDTGDCTKKSINLLPGEDFICVEKEIYESIEFCSYFKVVDGKLRRKSKETAKINLKLTNNGSFATIKNNMLFVVNTDYKGSVENWEYQ
jgi:hypothetical protein